MNYFYNIERVKEIYGILEGNFFSIYLSKQKLKQDWQSKMTNISFKRLIISFKVYHKSVV